MTIQLESNGILDSLGPAPPPPTTALTHHDTNISHTHTHTLPSSSPSLAQKALNHLAHRPTAFALHHHNHGMPSDAEIEQLLQDEEEQRHDTSLWRHHDQPDDYDDLLALAEAQQDDEQDHNHHHHHKQPQATAATANTAPTIELEDILGFTQHATAAPSASTASTTHTGAPALSALAAVEAEIEREAASQLPLPSCAQQPIDIDGGHDDDEQDHPSIAPGPSTHRQPPRNEAGIPKYIPAGFTYATTFDGKEIRFERQKRLKAWKPSQAHPETPSGNLIAVPVYKLRQQIDALEALKVVERQEEHEARAAAAAVAAASAATMATGKKSRSAAQRTGQMWVDRYRPRKFTELLGDERVHRDVLGWLKEWDECVFKRKNLRKERHRQYLEAKSAAAAAQQIGGATAQFGSFDANSDKKPWRDPWGRPSERVLMVSGPPGLGKTTLAHVIAQHAGYNVYELNASDARTAGAVEDRIRMALESGSLKDPRPTLVVIDEIDGATGGGGGGSGGGTDGVGFVRALVKLIENGKGSTSYKSGSGDKRTASGAGKKKKRGHKPLLRPIICVCNDLYAPALRPLRPLSKLIRFNKAPTNHVVKRLREICDIEGVQADTRGLSLLCELTGGDLRACINALEFAKTRDVYLSESAVRNAAVGIKDTGTTVHRVWEMLFKTQTRKEKIKSSTRGAQAGVTDGWTGGSGGGGGAGASAPWNNRATVAPSSSSSSSSSSAVAAVGGGGSSSDALMVDTPAANVHRLIHEITSCGEYDKLSQGCFEHYPHLRASDDGWRRFRQVHEWLDFSQLLSSRAWAGGSFELLAYLPWTLIPWHTLFANSVNPLPEYPKTEYEHHLRTTAFGEIATTLHANLPPSLRSCIDRKALVLELGPTLGAILSPELKPIQNTLASPWERETLKRLVEVMLSLNLSLVQDREEGGEAGAPSSHTATGNGLVWKLDPPIDVFGLFSSPTVSTTATATATGGGGAGGGYAKTKTRLSLRALIARELEKERQRRRLPASSAGDDMVGEGEEQSTAAKAMSVYRRQRDGTSSTVTDSTSLKGAGKVAKDFFGRVIVPPSSSSSRPADAAAAGAAAGPAGGELPAIPEGMVIRGSRKSSSNYFAPTAAATATATGTKEAQKQGLKVFYRYHEGYSNAVRRPVKMASLL